MPSKVKNAHDMYHSVKLCRERIAAWIALRMDADSPFDLSYCQFMIDYWQIQLGHAERREHLSQPPT